MVLGTMGGLMMGMQYYSGGTYSGSNANRLGSSNEEKGVGTIVTRFMGIISGGGNRLYCSDFVQVQDCSGFCNIILFICHDTFQ